MEKKLEKNMLVCHNVRFVLACAFNHCAIGYFFNVISKLIDFVETTDLLWNLNAHHTSTLLV